MRSAAGRRGPTRAAVRGSSEISWLEPYPESLLEGIADAAPGPEVRYESKEAIGLAFVAGLQHLAPRQRAVLVLRDVLGFHADEVAEMLAVSAASVNSALQRARSTLDGRLPVARDRLAMPLTGAERELVVRFADAFERDDIDSLVAMLTDDVVISMPPEPLWLTGPGAVGAFLRERRARRPGPWRFVATSANGQPAYAYYLAEGDEMVRSGLLVIGVRADGIESITRFRDRGLLDGFDVPRRLPAV